MEVESDGDAFMGSLQTAATVVIPSPPPKLRPKPQARDIGPYKPYADRAAFDADIVRWDEERAARKVLTAERERLQQKARDRTSRTRPDGDGERRMRQKLEQKRASYTGLAKFYLDNGHPALADFVAADKEDEFSALDDWASREGLVKPWRERLASMDSAERNFDEEYNDEGFTDDILRAWRASSGYQEYLNWFSEENVIRFKHPNHRHELWPVKFGAWTCNVCGTGFPKATCKYACMGGCDWNCCNSCLHAASQLCSPTSKKSLDRLAQAELEFDERPIHQRPMHQRHVHELRLSRPTEVYPKHGGKWVCSVCRKLAVRNDPMWHCQHVGGCTFDMCSACKSFSESNKSL